MGVRGLAGAGRRRALGCAGCRRGRRAGAGRLTGFGRRAGAGKHSGGSGARGRRTLGRCAVATGHGRRAGRAAWASGLAVGCALGALGLFLIRFDSVFFLSQFLDIVREPGS